MNNEKQALHSDLAPKAIGPYSQAVQVGNLVFVSGQIPADPAGNPIKGTIAELTNQCLGQVDAILRTVGLSLSDVVKTTVYMTDLSQFPAMNEAYAGHFKQPYPARATVEVKSLPKGVSIEIDAVAIRK
jgi:2-iminobutanoate/2-iminopropanoate deaminase